MTAWRIIVGEHLVSEKYWGWKLEASPEWGKERMFHIHMLWLLYPGKNINVASGEKWDEISCSIRMATINNASLWVICFVHKNKLMKYKANHWTVPASSKNRFSRPCETRSCRGPIIYLSSASKAKYLTRASYRWHTNTHRVLKNQQENTKTSSFPKTARDVIKQQLSAAVRPDLTYISLLIIPCIIYHVTNKETLTLLSSSWPV